MKTSLSLLLFFLILISLGCGSSKPITDENDKLLIWDQEKKLAWTDFRGQPAAEDMTADWSAIGFSFVAYRIVDKKQTLIAAYFDRDRSWSVRQRDDLLKHEQYHFNITESFARQIRKKVMEEKLKPGTDAFEKVYTDNLKALGTRQKEYDEMTQHGKNTDQQIAQEKLIDERLNAFAEFKNSLIVY